MAGTRTVAGSHPRLVYERLRGARLRRLGPTSQASKFEASFEAGARGERVFGDHLDAAAKARGLLVSHSLLRPDGGDIDHVVVGPAGVFVIDSKLWSGRVSIGKDTLWQGRFNREGQVEGVRKQVGAVRAVLDQAGFKEVPVEGLMCMVARNRGIALHGLSELPGIAVGLPESVIERTSRPGPLSPQQIVDIRDVITRPLQPAEPLVVPLAWTRPAPEAKPGRQQPKAKQRRRLRPLLAVIVLLIATAALAQLKPVAYPPRTPHASYPGRSLASLRKTARRRAGGPVAGPHRRRRGNNLELVYRRAPSCRVIINLPSSASRRPQLRSSGCRKD